MVHVNFVIPGYFPDGAMEKPIVPLLSRAWLYQERRLSRRFLHFTQKEIIWECREVSTCECYSSDKPMPEKRDLPNYVEDAYLKQNHQKSLAGGIGAIARRWRNIAEEYSQLSLTFGKDKLPALSGMSSQCLAQAGIPYAAGVLPTDMPHSLLWMVPQYPVNRRVKPKEWRAPSWSWAAVDFPARYYDSGKELSLTEADAEVLEIHCQTEERAQLVRRSRARFHSTEGLLGSRKIARRHAVNIV
jgi:hypothetical protein